MPREPTITGDAFLEWLGKNEIIKDIGTVRRVIVDAQYQAPLRVYVERAGSPNFIAFQPPDLLGAQFLILEKEGLKGSG